MKLFRQRILQFYEEGRFEIPRVGGQKMESRYGKLCSCDNIVGVDCAGKIESYAALCRRGP